MYVRSRNQNFQLLRKRWFFCNFSNLLLWNFFEINSDLLWDIRHLMQWRKLGVDRLVWELEDIENGARTKFQSKLMSLGRIEWNWEGTIFFSQWSWFGRRENLNWIQVWGAATTATQTSWGKQVVTEQWVLSDMCGPHCHGQKTKGWLLWHFSWQIRWMKKRPLGFSSKIFNEKSVEKPTENELILLQTPQLDLTWLTQLSFQMKHTAFAATCPCESQFSGEMKSCILPQVQVDLRASGGQKAKWKRSTIKSDNAMVGQCLWHHGIGCSKINKPKELLFGWDINLSKLLLTSTRQCGEHQLPLNWRRIFFFVKWIFLLK